MIFMYSYCTDTHEWQTICVIKFLSKTDWSDSIINGRTYSAPPRKKDLSSVSYWIFKLKHSETQTGRWKIQEIDISLSVALLTQHQADCCYLES